MKDLQGFDKFLNDRLSIIGEALTINPDINVISDIQQVQATQKLLELYRNNK